MSDEENSEETICIMTLGNSGVGKTSFISRYTKNIFVESYLATIGFDYKTKKINIKNKEYKLLLYDTAGQERYKSLAPNMIRKSHGIIIMYDITNESSFDSIPEIIKKIFEEKGENFPLILLGNKIDQEQKRIISKEQGEKLADRYNINFFEISNKEGINIKEAGDLLVSIILENRKNENSIEYKRESLVNSLSSQTSKFSNKDSDGCSKC